MGVGNYQFSRDEQERKKQMEFFKNIEKEVENYLIHYFFSYFLFLE